MNIQDVFQTFDRLLSERLAVGVYNSEDSLRYTFFLALTTCAYCRHTEVILERPHPQIAGAEIDLLILPAQDRLSTAFEFKFDRPIPSNRNLPLTQKAGAVFKDLFRLARVPDEFVQFRYFVYITAQAMKGYFLNPINGFVNFFSLKEQDSFSLSSEFIANRPATFRGTVGDMFIPCLVKGAYSQDYPNGYSLRVFEVK